MLRELTINEMEIVSGGHFNEDNTQIGTGLGFSPPSTLDMLGNDAGWIHGGEQKSLFELGGSDGTVAVDTGGDSEGNGTGELV